MLSNKSILITGGTGSFGKAFVKTPFLAATRTSSALVISTRDDLKQLEMAKQFPESEPWPKGGISWGYSSLHRTSDMPCPTTM